MTLAAGFFDGVHLGHREVLRGADAAFTFDVHPAAVFAPERVPPLLSTTSDRMARIRASGVKDVRLFNFTKAFSQMPPDVFVRELFKVWPALHCIRCGADWHFGARNSGDVSTLRALGLEVIEVPPVLSGGAPVSSTRIRQALAQGDVSGANALLGYSFAFSGIVCKGKGLGRTFGCPTLNLHCAIDARLLPLGAWAVVAPEPFGVGIANWGLAPTMGETAWREPTLEIHFLDVPSALAWPSVGMPFSVFPMRFMRSERRFDSIEALSRQLEADVRQIRALHLSEKGLALSPALC